jgi:2-phosphosulfolactate phosphatase
LLTLEVCLTPSLIEQHSLSGKAVVVVDIFRATSCMITGMNHGIAAIYPVATVDECTQLGAKGMVMAGERDGKKISHFDIGNSPFEYMMDEWKGRELTVSTTNGTLAIQKSQEGNVLVMGAFLNLTATVQYLFELNKDVVIHCAGWKGTPNTEDTLYAGMLISRLMNHSFELSNDSAQLALALYENHQSDLLSAAKKSSHAHRLAKFGITKDIEFCMEVDRFAGVVICEGNKLIKI